MQITTVLAILVASVLAAVLDKIRRRQGSLLSAGAPIPNRAPAMAFRAQTPDAPPAAIPTPPAPVKAPRPVTVTAPVFVALPTAEALTPRLPLAKFVPLRMPRAISSSLPSIKRTTELNAL
jgi:hypothetical protein